MKMSVGTMAALVVVAVAVSALVINFGMVQAMEDKVKASIKANLKLEQKGVDVKVKVKANGLASGESFTLRAYGSVNCNGSLLPNGEIDTEMSNNKGKLNISGELPIEDIGDVNSVSIRSTGSPPDNPPVVCFQNTTP